MKIGDESDFYDNRVRHWPERVRLLHSPSIAEAKAIQDMPEDGLEDVERKRASFDDLHQKSGWVHRKLACDLWTGAFFTPKTNVPPSPGLYTVPLTDHVWLAWGGSGLKDELIERAEKIARESSFFHWPIEFADVMSDGGFDCVIGNPPWERMKLQEQEFFASRDIEIATAPTAAARTQLIGELKNAEVETPRKRLYQQFEAAKRNAEASSTFARVPGGRFALTGRGDVNTYALFAELFSRLNNAHGRAGVIVPTGIATDATTAPFFASLIDMRRLASLIDFENRRGIFPAVHRSFKFSLLTLGSDVTTPSFAFFLADPVQLKELERRFTLNPGEIARINPNTKTAPVFRSKSDAELAAKIYSRVPVLINEGKGQDGNPWGISFGTMFHMSNDSGLFKTGANLRGAKYKQDGRNWVLQAKDDDVNKAQPWDYSKSDSEIFVPLYEAKMIHHFDHRWATYEGEDIRDSTDIEKVDCMFNPCLSA
jgi:hypothetical protein